MKDNHLFREHILYFVMGMLTVFCLVVLTGAGSGTSLSGRYQIAAWGTMFGEGAGGCGAFVVDTATGKTKTVYTVIYGVSPQRSLLVNNLRKTFNTIR